MRLHCGFRCHSDEPLLCKARATETDCVKKPTDDNTVGLN